MSIFPIPSINAVLTKATGMIRRHSLSEAANAQGYEVKNSYHQHKLHYFLKGVGQLPAPLIAHLNRYLAAPTAEQYPHADAHMRLIIAVNNKLKRPLKLDSLLKFRQQFATNAISMQALNVWEQPDADMVSVNWQDKTIANAGHEDMTIRCYRQLPQNNDENIEHKAKDETVMLFFHGGGFCIGDLDTHHEFCHTLCAQTGWSVVSVDYRLAPEHPAPAALKDCIAAYAWLAEHCHTLGAKPSRIVLSGDSAGGCLAILVAQQVINPSIQMWQDIAQDNSTNETFTSLLEDLPTPLAQLPLYPVTDIEANYPSWELYGQGLLLDHSDIEVFDAAYMQQSPFAQSHPLVAPMHGDNKQMCPSYIVAAELDILRDEALVFAKRLQEYGIEVQTHTVLGAPHGFIHLMSVHKGIGKEINHIINGFKDFVQQLIARQSN